MIKLGSKRFFICLSRIPVVRRCTPLIRIAMTRPSAGLKVRSVNKIKTTGVTQSDCFCCNNGWRPLLMREKPRYKTKKLEPAWEEKNPNGIMQAVAINNNPLKTDGKPVLLDWSIATPDSALVIKKATLVLIPSKENR